MHTPSMMAVPISTVNITGLRTSIAGLSLTKDCLSASFTREASNNRLLLLFFDMMILFYFILLQPEKFGDGSQRQGREETQGHHDGYHGKYHDTESRSIRFECTRAFGDVFLFGQDTGNGYGSD